MKPRITPLLLSALLAAGCTVGVPAVDDASVPRDAVVADAPSIPDGGPLACAPGATIGDACSTSSECDDGCFCTGIEMCVEGACVQRAAPCVDEIECTADTCDEETNRCGFEGRDEMCDDGDLCNGAEACVPGRGCRPGLRLTCSDGDPCTVGSCDTEVGCSFVLRDLDGDGYADHRCGGPDCNDDPVIGGAISPDGMEVCDNGYDDDCDGLIDARDPTCGAANDTCETAELLPGAGTYVRTTRGAASDYPLGCRTTGIDTVFRFTLDAAADVQATLTVDGGAGSVAIRPAASCATGPDTYCADAGVLARDLAPGEYVIIVRTSTGTTFTLNLARMGATPVRPTDVCDGSTVDISAGGTFTGFFSDVRDDYRLACRTGTTSFKDVAYRLVLTEPRDVRITASTGATTTYLSLVRDCTSATSSIACVQRASAEIFRRSMAPGTYFVLLESSSSTATTWSLTADIMPAAMRNEGDACSTAVDITDATASIPLSALELDYGTSCGGATSASRDATFSFTTTALSDVVLTTEVGSVHYVSVSSTCGDVATESVCTSGTPRVVQRLLRVPAGTHHVTVSTALSTGMITASAAIEPPTFPPPNDTCDGATDLVDSVLVTGDLLAAADDILGCGNAGSVDTVHRLVVATRSNVTFVARRTDGSGEPLSIGLRTACTTPSSDLACAAGAPALLDRTLEPGTHYVVVESSRGAVGPYSLVVYLADP